MAGIKIQLRTSNGKDLLDGQWVGETILDKGDNSFGYNNGVYNCWMPDLNLSDNELVLGEEACLTGLDSNGVSSSKLILGSPDSLLVEEVSSGKKGLTLSSTGISLDIAPGDMSNRSAPGYCWRTTSFDLSDDTEVAFIVDGLPDELLLPIPDSSFIVWSSEAQTSQTAIYYSLNNLDNEGYFFPDKTNLGLSVENTVIPQKEYLTGRNSIATLKLRVEAANGKFNFTNVGVRTLMTDVSLLDKKFFLYYAVTVGEPDVASPRLPFYFSHRHGFGSNLIDKQIAIISTPYQTVVKIEYDPDNFSEQERNSGNLTIDLIHDIIFDRDARVVDATYFKVTDCFASFDDLDNPLEEFYISLPELSMENAESLCDKITSRRITMRHGQLFNYNFSQKMYSDNYEVAILESERNLIVEEKSVDGFTLRATNSVVGDTWLVQFLVRPLSTTLQTF